MSTPGEIRSDAVYSLEEAQTRLRMAKTAWRGARADGLPVRRVGRRRFVLGSDLVGWFAAQPVDRMAPHGAGIPSPKRENPNR